MNTQPYFNWLHTQLDEIIKITPERHGDQSEVFHVSTRNGNFYLKISSDLKRELNNLRKFEGKLPVPKVVGFTHIEEKDALLMSTIKGKNLAKLVKEWTAEKVVKKYAEALKIFHSFLSDESQEGTNVLVHGDFCMPNVIFDGDVLSGFIDLGDARIGSVEVDLAAAIWSLERNIGKGYGLDFLRAYGISDRDEDYVLELWRKYENDEFDI